VPCLATGRLVCGEYAETFPGRRRPAPCARCCGRTRRANGGCRAVSWARGWSWAATLPGHGDCCHRRSMFPTAPCRPWAAA